MKRILLCLFSILLVLTLSAQVPQAFKYQTVVRNASDEIIKNTNVYFRISILQGSSSGTEVYKETFSLSTNDFGLAAFNIGQGTVKSGDFATISWSSYDFWVKVELDPDAAGSEIYEEVGTSQLLSVPYALLAKSASNYDETDPKVGTNTTNYLSKWDGSALVKSAIFDNGNIGIGTNNPGEILNIKTTTPDGNIKLEVPDGDGYYIGYNGGGDYMAISVINGSTPFWETLNLKSGNVGIGTNNPTSKLHVIGNAHVTGNLTIDGSVAIASAPANPTDAATKAYVDDLEDQITALEEKLASNGLMVKDIDGNFYNTVKIGRQVWMAENLRVTKYPDGAPIPMVTDNSTWDALTLTDRAYTFYNNDAANAKEWGGYYTWSTVTNGGSSNTNPGSIQGICPDGWHVPSDAEWQELELYLGMSPSDTSKTGLNRGTNEGGRLKEAGLVHFWSPNSGATNETGFTALPAGNRTYNYGIIFDNLHKYPNYWTSRKSGDGGFTRALYYQYSTIGRGSNDHRTGISCRCVKNQVSGTSSDGINTNSTLANLSADGVVAYGTVDVNNTGFGAALFVASDGNYEEADADATATMPAVALALETGTGSKKILLQGYIRNDSWTWTPGGLIFISPTAGILTQTRPSTAGQQVQIVGYAVKSNTVFFIPNIMLIELK